MNFEDLNLETRLLKELKSKGYTTATPIQEKAIPEILAGNDLLGLAQTGTGKTAAFALPILQKLSASPRKFKKIRALVLAPTRELAQQISQSFFNYGKGLQVKQTVVYGGVSTRPQADSIHRGTDILIATPGRLLDLMDQRIPDLSELEFLVLDEVDRMLDMGFVKDIKSIVAQIPPQRQTLMFSATLPGEIKKLASGLLRNPITIQVAPPSTTSENVSQSVYFIQRELKRKLLVSILGTEPSHYMLVFTRTKRGADRLNKTLNGAGFPSDCIHGDKTQAARQIALQKFKNKKVRILVATDVASRGLDINEISHVVNYDLPEDSESYVHRIGRTGRAGTLGKALTFCSQDEMGFLKDIKKLNGIKLETIQVPDLSAIDIPAGENTPKNEDFRRSENSFRRRDKRPRNEGRNENRNRNRNDNGQEFKNRNEGGNENRNRNENGQEFKSRSEGGNETRNRNENGQGFRKRNAGGGENRNGGYKKFGGKKKGFGFKRKRKTESVA